jgi:hypothetical protein
MTARRPYRMLLVLAALALAAALLAGCGVGESKSVSEGEPVQLGELQYNILFTRFLNPDDVEDQGYLVGQPAPGPDKLYMGVFVEILNKSKESSLTVPSNWYVIDTQKNTYDPLPTSSPYALALGGKIGPEDQAPALDSTPQVGPIGGALVLFSIPDSATQDRPLKLVIPGANGPAKIQLDI